MLISLQVNHELIMFVKNIELCQNEKDVGNDFVLN